MTVSALIQKRLTNIFEARKVLAAAESKARLKMAEKSTRAPKLEKYNYGDQVNYKFGKEPGWHGPGRIVAQDNKLVFIRHARNIIVSSLARVFKVVDNHSLPIVNQVKDTPALKPNNQVDLSHNQANTQDLNTQNHSDDSDEEDIGIQSQVNTRPRNEPNHEDTDLNTNDFVTPNGKIPCPVPTPPKSPTGGSIRKKPRKNNKKSSPSSYQMSSPRVYPKAGDVVFIKPKGDESNSWERITIAKRVTKGVSSPHGPYYNFRKQNGTLDGHYLDYYDWHLDNTHQRKISSHVIDIYVFLESEGHTTPDFTHIEPANNWYRNPNLEENEAYVVFIPKKDHQTPDVINAKLKELQLFKDYQ